MTTYIVESWRPDSSDGDSKVSCRIMERDWNPRTGDDVWRYKRHTFSDWDWELDALENHKLGVIAHVKIRLEKNPITVERGGETVRGYLWIITISV